MFKKSLLTICFLQAFSTVTYAIIYSTLVLMLIHKHNLSSNIAYSILAIFFIYNFALHFMGSWLGTKVISCRSLFLICMVIQVIGGVFLVFDDYNVMLFGLLLFLISTGFNAPCLSIILKEKTRHDSVLSEKSFLLNYAFINIGFFAAYLMAGFAQLNYEYSKLFIYAEIFNVASLLITIIGWKYLKDDNSISKLKHDISTIRQAILRYIFVIGLIFFSAFVIILSSYEPRLAKYFTIICSILILVGLYVYSLDQKKPKDKSRLLAYIVLIVFSLVFWSMHYLSPMSLTVFAHNNVDLRLFDYNIAPQWLPNLEIFAIVLGGFFFPSIFKAIRKITPLTIPALFGMAILMMGLGFAMLVFGLVFTDSHGFVNIIWIMLFYLIQGLAEVIIASVGLSMTGLLAPLKHQGIMMGAGMFLRGATTSVIASFLSSTIIVTSNHTSPLESNHSYLLLYSILALVGLLVSLLIYSAMPKINRMIG